MDAVANKRKPVKMVFSGYQKFVVAILAFLQFTIILDFMIISPLGAIVMPALHISPRQFGWAVSSYAFSAAISGISAAGFADRFDRKRLLLFFYGGFILGTLLCALAPDYHFLLLARIVTGLFGGVIGSVVLAIATDLFPLEMRGRVMGFIQTAFAAAQILGLPAGIYFANRWNWHIPFVAIIAIAVPASIVIMLYMKPVAAHLKLKQERSPLWHLIDTLIEPRYTLAFCVTILLATGGYMLMPFGSAYIVNNVGLSLTTLPTIYLVTGLFTVFLGPMVGKISDRFGKFQTFFFGTAVSLVMVVIWTNLGRASLPVVIVINVLLFVGIFSRMVPAQALISAIPAVTKRGSFNAISASLQQLSGGVASVGAGLIIAQNSDGRLLHFNWLGYIVMMTALAGLILMYFIHKAVPERLAG
ncbi:MAG TPA: MFS transporter [Rhizomicrobium sp.]|jgi:predicted MFS family arabinose efflux permease|nr:MFS transporter [Rhizomicrobium sp.]